MFTTRACKDTQLTTVLIAGFAFKFGFLRHEKRGDERNDLTKSQNSKCEKHGPSHAWCDLRKLASGINVLLAPFNLQHFLSTSAQASSAVCVWLRTWNNLQKEN